MSQFLAGVRENLRKETDRRLLNMLNEVRNTISSRDEWLKLGFALHAGYCGTEWEHEVYVGWIEFSERWETPAGTRHADFEHNADEVWSGAKADRNGRVLPATAQMILSKLPKLPPKDIQAVKIFIDDEQQVVQPIKLTGLAGEIADLMRLASDRKLTVLPEAAALVAISALAAPTFVIKGPQGKTTLNIYALVLGGTGSGKEACRKAADMVLSSAGRPDEILDGVASDKALHRALGSNSGAYTIAVDEGGLHLDAIRRGNNGHQQMLLSLMMRLWGLGLGRLPPHKYADNRNEIPAVTRPRLTMIWTSTPETLARATGQEDSESGYLNRYLVFKEPGFPQLRQGVVDRDVLQSEWHSVHGYPCRSRALICMSQEAADLCPAFWPTFLPWPYWEFART